ncbi:hypothetical protein AVEN_226991-1 [Araneus ventricosus]|uniref:Uncharacterized protein n=1 Tax=Araneus ventricosus TaxID=182803 RepID=A0A4Y2WGP1_ARAVE|nr:hypothetical protein AVEN_226991-1 [Araneus ventricosus]
MLIEKPTQGMKYSRICLNFRGASSTNVPEDIKNRPNLDDDAIISDDKAVKELLDEDADNDFEQKQFCSSPHQKVAKCNKGLDFFFLKTANL